MTNQDGQLEEFLAETSAEIDAMHLSPSQGDAFYIAEALKHAVMSARTGHNGVGAIITDQQKVITAIGHNETKDPRKPDAFLRHAELMALCDLNTQLPAELYVDGDAKYTMYPSLEPCGLCVHGILLERRRIQEVVYGGFDYGGAFSLDQLAPVWKGMRKRSGLIFRPAEIPGRLRFLCEEVFRLSNLAIKARDPRNRKI